MKPPPYPRWHGNPEVIAFIRAFEESHFRTVEDTGANPSAMHLWNMVRFRAGLPGLTLDDLPRYDAAVDNYVLPKGSKLTGIPAGAHGGPVRISI